MSTRPSQCPELVRHREAWTGAQLSCPWRSKIVSTPVGQSLTAGVGDVVLRAEGRENMPNIIGRADLFGRTRPTGFTTIQYGGMQGNKVVLLRAGVTTQSDATTMNSTPLIVPTQQQSTISENVGGAPVFSDGHNHWNGLHPAVWLYICEQFAIDNSDSHRLAQESASAGSRQGNRNRRRDTHIIRLPNRMKHCVNAESWWGVHPPPTELSGGTSECLAGSV
jgi:hypothetical protein